MCHLLYFVLFTIITVLLESVEQKQQYLIGNDWDNHPSFYSPNGRTPNGESRAPILMKFIHNLTTDEDDKGVCGICSRVYWVLYQTQFSPIEECRRFYNSKQSGFGDITEFYNILMKNPRFNETLEFPLADRFPRFSFRASIVYSAYRSNEPGLLIETGSDTKQLLCVQSIKCPEPITTTVSVPPVTTVLTTTTSPASIILDPSVRSASVVINEGTNDGRDRSSNLFWDTLLSGTEPKSWFLATVSLTGICLLLIIILLGTWLYICRLKKLHNQRRCHGTCRFGCRCPQDVIRQTAADAAVCGPLGLQTHQAYTNVISPHGNGSIRSGSGFGNTLYTAGTINSGRWGSNGHKVNTPHYMALGSTSDKTPMFSPGCTTPNCMLELPEGVSLTNNMDVGNESWNQRNGHQRNHRLRSRRTSQDMLRRSTSEGSSVSGATGAGGSSNCNNPRTYQFHPTQNVSFLDGTNTNIPPSMIVSNTNAGQRGLETNGAVYLQTGHNGYNYSDSGRGSGVSPGCSHSPTRLNGRKLTDRNYFNHQNSITGSNGPTSVDEEPEHEDLNFLGSHANKLLTNLQREFNACDTDPRNLTVHMNRDSDGDLLNITPPSGFYDQSGSCVGNNSTINGNFNIPDSNFGLNSNILMHSPNSFGRQAFTGALYPILGSPTTHMNKNISHTMPNNISIANNNNTTTTTAAAAATTTNIMNNNNNLTSNMNNHHDQNYHHLNTTTNNIIDNHLNLLSSKNIPISKFNCEMVGSMDEDIGSSNCNSHNNNHNHINNTTATSSNNNNNNTNTDIRMRKFPDTQHNYPIRPLINRPCLANALDKSRNQTDEISLNINKSLIQQQNIPDSIHRCVISDRIL